MNSRVIVFACLVAYASCCIELPADVEAAVGPIVDACLTERSAVAGPLIFGTILHSFARSECPSHEDIEAVMEDFPEATCMAKEAGWLNADGMLQPETIEAHIKEFLGNADQGFLDTLVGAAHDVANQCGVQLPADAVAWVDGGCPGMPEDAELECIYNEVVGACF